MLLYDAGANFRHRLSPPERPDECAEVNRVDLQLGILEPPLSIGGGGSST